MSCHHADIRYKLGFCPNGPDCRYRHQKQAGPPPPPEEAHLKLQQRVYAYSSHSHGNQWEADTVQHEDQRSLVPQSANRETVQGNQLRAESALLQSATQQQQQQEGNKSNLAAQEGQLLPPVDGHPGSLSVPLPSGNNRFFIVKSNNMDNLELSAQRGLWATHRNNEIRLNEAFDSCDHVILIFSVNETRHFQGCAQMMTKIGDAIVAQWKHANGMASFGHNFCVKWLKLCQLSFQKTRHLRNPYKDDLPVKISRDCQELEPNVGSQLARLLYAEPDSDLMAVAREAEKVKGITETQKKLQENQKPVHDSRKELKGFVPNTANKVSTQPLGVEGTEALEGPQRQGRGPQRSDGSPFFPSRSPPDPEFNLAHQEGHGIPFNPNLPRNDYFPPGSHHLPFEFPPPEFNMDGRNGYDPWFNHGADMYSGQRYGQYAPLAGHNGVWNAPGAMGIPGPFAQDPRMAGPLQAMYQRNAPPRASRRVSPSPTLLQKKTGGVSRPSSSNAKQGVGTASLVAPGADVENGPIPSGSPSSMKASRKGSSRNSSEEQRKDLSHVPRVKRTKHDNDYGEDEVDDDIGFDDVDDIPDPWEAAREAETGTRM